MNPKLALLLLFFFGLLHSPLLGGEFQAGAAIVDVTPEKLPVLVNGGMRSRSVDTVNTRVNARAIVLADGEEQIAIVVADSCMMPRPLLDEAKALAEQRTGIKASRLLISATHTHTAPSCMGCLGTDADPAYVPVLRKKLAEAIAAAQAKLEPARVGFAKADAADYTALRRWIHRPDKLTEDPFGNLTGRAHMHSGKNWDNVTGESGPEDPDLSLISFQSKDGRPLAVLANFSMHYFGDKALSADYFGLFAEGLKAALAPDSDFVGIMAHGCSGDIWRRDYTKPEGERGEGLTIQEYADALKDIALKAYADIEYRDDADLEMAEARMTLNYRVPNQQRLEWAKREAAKIPENGIPEDQVQVYAREQLILHERQSTEIVIQGLRIGDIGIATTPNETYAITGLKIKAASPLKRTMVIELANGGDGYIPPPEQHRFGGYNTWPARSAGLEVMAEPKITAKAIEMLEKVAAKPRRFHQLSRGPAVKAILDLKPAAYWRMDEFAGPRAIDASGHDRDAIYEPDVTFFLEGPRSDYFCENGETNRAAMFAGARMQARVPDLGDSYSVSLWLWNGMPADAREVNGWLFSRGTDHGLHPAGDHLGIGGTNGFAGKLMFFHGSDPAKFGTGKTEIPRWTWSHVVFVRDGDVVSVYLNGELDLECGTGKDIPDGLDRLFIGGRSDNESNWEGRLDEVTVFDRALTAADVARLNIE